MSELQRDRWGRPLIIPVGGGDPIAYVRTSTLAKSLDDQSNLMAWTARVTAVGLALSPHLLDRVASLANKHADPVTDARRDLNGVVKDAKLAAGGSSAADVGTALHEMTEVVDSGQELRLAGRWTDHLDAYVNATRHLEMLEMETFVVNDDVKSAGTFDRLVRLPDGRVVVADLKTGKSDADYPLGVATQIAIYANGLRYDPETGERSPLHADLDKTVGLLIHLPSKLSPPVCRIWDLDLVRGYEAAVEATKVRKIRSWKAADLASERVRVSIGDDAA